MPGKHPRVSKVMPGPHIKLQRVETDFVGDTLKVMGLGRVGGDRGRKSCRFIRDKPVRVPLCWRQSLRAAVGVDGAMPSAMLPTSDFRSTLS